MMRLIIISSIFFSVVFFMTGCQRLPVAPHSAAGLVLLPKQLPKAQEIDSRKAFLVKQKQIQIKEENFLLEVSDTLELRARGLMDRLVLPENSGMLFLYSSPRMVSFWMAHTNIALDLILLDARGCILNLYTMEVEEPKKKDESEHSYRNRLRQYDSKKPVKAAIEFNKGIIQTLGLKAGDIISWK